MSDKNATTLIHIAGALAIAACLWLAYTVLRPYPEASIMLVGVATFLYGVLGFKPADPVLARILQRLNPAIVAAMSTRPPPAIVGHNTAFDVGLLYRESKPVPGDADYQPRTVSDVVNQALATGKVAVGSNVIDNVGLRIDAPKETEPPK